MKRIPLSVRLDSSIKEMALALAKTEHRTVTNLIEIMIVERYEGIKKLGVAARSNKD